MWDRSVELEDHELTVGEVLSVLQCQLCFSELREFAKEILRIVESEPFRDGIED